jgi:hypothetical protein
VTDAPNGSGATRFTRTDRVHVGWHYAQAHQDPGPPPQPPTPHPEPEPEPAEAARTGPGRRREENLLDRPLKIVAAGAGLGALGFVAAAVSGVLPWLFAGLALAACVFVLSVTGNAIWQGERALRSRADAERARLERARESQERCRTAAREEHARAHREWERRRQAYEAQREWHPVSVPPGVDRVDVAGGTLAGWSAAVTMMGAARLAAGSQVSVLDLSEGAVAGDLLRLAGDHGDDPLVWVLPADLPRLDLTRGLGPETMADVLSLVVGAGEERSSTRDLSFDNAILERIIRILDGGGERPAERDAGAVTIPQITAALRALAQVGDPRDDLRRGLLTDGQLERITTMFGRGAADRVVIEHAWALESQLRKLETLGTDPVWLPPSRLHVVSMDRRAGVLTNRILGTYVATALTHALREAPAGRRWDHTLFLCGAEKLRGDVLDRLIDACETTGTGLVLMYRSIPAHVRERLGRGHAAAGFMRLGNAADARFAADHIGVEHRLLVAEVTDTAGEAVADRKGTPYASTVDHTRVRRADALTDPVWTPLPAPVQDAEALAYGITTSTTWAKSVAGHAAERSGAPDGRRRSRELRVDQHQMQELPPTAMVLTYAAPSGRRVVLVDANPGIMTLPTAHTVEYEEYAREQTALAEKPGVEPHENGDARAKAGGRGGHHPETPVVPRSTRARHAAPRGVSPRSPKAAPPLRSEGRHAAGGDRGPVADPPAPNPEPHPEPPAECIDSLP